MGGVSAKGIPRYLLTPIVADGRLVVVPMIVPCEHVTVGFAGAGAAVTPIAKAARAKAGADFDIIVGVKRLRT